MIRTYSRLLLASALGLTAVFSPLAAFAEPGTPAPRAAPQEAGRLTFEDTFRVGFGGSSPRIVRWLKSGKEYLVYGALADGAPQLLKVDARTGKQTAFLDVARMQSALALSPEIGADGAASVARRPNLTLSDDENRALFSYKNDLYVYEFASATLTRLTNTPDKQKQEVSFSPDARQVAWVSDGNLYSAALAAPGKERQLTRDGSDLVMNGTLDWVYEEEVYGRGKPQGYDWSPDSKRIAFLRIDDAPVHPFTIVDHLPVRQNEEHERYPKAGDANPLATLHVISSAGGTPTTVDISGYPANDRLIVRFGWLPGSNRLTFQMQPRNQRQLDLNVADAQTGKAKLLLRETSPAWVEILDNPIWLKDGSFLWLTDRTGFRHLLRVTLDGKAPRPITQGNWDIRDVIGVDADQKWVYFMGAKESAIAPNAYRAPLAGGSPDAPQRLTSGDGTHAVRFAPDYGLIVDTNSSVSRPPQTRLLDGATGKEVRVIEDNAALRERLTRYQLSTPELLTVKTRDGFVMNARILKPVPFDPNKKYPVWMEVYGGPGTQTVHNSWDGSAWDQFLAQQGYIVWECDNRSASGQGLQSQFPIYRRFGESELADVEDSLTYLKTLPYVDGGRIGITGWSFGGFLTEYALTHSKSFKVGIAGAGVSDWHLYDSIYTERYMDTPQANPDGYVRTAPTQSARDLSGKLLIVHGLMDDNVHVQNSVTLVYELERAGRDFEVNFYPSPRSRHGIGDPLLSRHLRTLEWKFINENL